jgi:metal-sulfur cluster biosynthetic enzyme
MTQPNDPPAPDLPPPGPDSASGLPASGSEPVGAFVPPPAATVEDLMEALRDVVDPELGVSVVDLGLVYGLVRDDDGHVTIDMTLTTPMCPLTGQIEDDARYVLSSLASGVTINWVWLPPWTMDNITEDGREQLRALGYNL